MRSFIVLWLGFCLALPGPVFAQPPAPKNPAPVSGKTAPAYVAKARESIDAVLAEPEFDQTKTVKVPELKSKKTTEKKKGSLDAFLRWLEELFRSWEKTNTDTNSLDFGQLVAKYGEVILWLLVFGLIVLLGIYSKHWLPLLGFRRSRKKILPLSEQSDSALEIAVPLPEDLVASVERCWREGRRNEALSLLYRGAIELMTDCHRIDLPQGATEGEIHLLVGNAMPSFKDDFGNIVRAWLRLAYAHRPPTDIAGLLAGFARLQQGAVS